MQKVEPTETLFPFCTYAEETIFDGKFRTFQQLEPAKF